jgi:hypothetical protein
MTGTNSIRAASGLGEPATGGDGTQADDPAGASSAARESDNALPVNSMVVVSAPEKPRGSLVLIRVGGKVYGIERESLSGDLAAIGDRGVDLKVEGVEHLDERPEHLAVYGDFNLVEYRGKFYGAPHGTLIDNWGKVESGFYGEKLIVRDSFADLRWDIVRIMAERGVLLDVSADEGAWRPTASQASGAADLSDGGAQRLIRSLDGYDIYRYEGIHYGIPAHYGPVRLDEIDESTLVGVIRDVSVDVVENEIRSLSDATAR